MSTSIKTNTSPLSGLIPSERSMFILTKILMVMLGILLVVSALITVFPFVGRHCYQRVTVLRFSVPSIAIMVFWKYTGFNIVLYTTGLMTIPKDILEAARMDGANAFRRFWNISLPMIRPFIFFAITMTIIGNLQMFEEPFVLTRGTGGTGQSGLTISMYLYKVGWEWLEMGTASAISWLLFALIATCTLVQFLLFGKKGLGEH